MKKIATIVGARPQFIKASVVSEKLKEAEIQEIVIHTGQHYDYNMSDVFFKELGMKKPDYNLETGSGSHGDMTGRMLIEIEKVFLKEKPDMVLVYGDTNSTLAGALAASKLNIPAAHVEAGLRSYNRKMPEEINRVLSDHISEYLFAPTEIAVRNLEKEGIIKNVFSVGDVMFDVALKVRKNLDGMVPEVLGKYDLQENSFILATIHRADNTDIEGNLRNIWEALIEIANSVGKVFFPIHPRTKKCLEKHNYFNSVIPENLIIADPVPYSEIIILESSARVIVTDSGGVQKESYFFKTPAVIPRDETEWVEIVDSGWNVLSGANKEKIISAVGKFYKDGNNRKWIEFYGDGNAAGKIVDIIK